MRLFQNSMWGLCALLFVVFNSLIAFVEPSTIVVDSPFGKIKGLKNDENTTSLSYVSFRGIPYAKPPLGDLRFAKPQAHPNIEGVFDATGAFPIVCPTPFSMAFGMTRFTEDCLVLNIMAKDIGDSDSLRKVIVYIHGGGFHFGNGAIHDPKTFVISQPDILVVTFNYRIGILGFLSTENDAGPGNYGLWDQTLALKWVKDNIRAFGGDPDDIAIIGESAGGSSVGFQAITTHAKGLFTKAYSLSGSVTSTYCQAVDAQSHALTFARLFDCWGGDDVGSKINVQESRAVIECLRKLPILDIMSYNTYDISKTQFVPRIDGDFISDAPAILLQNDEYLDSIGFFDRTYLVSVVNNDVGVGHNLFNYARSEIFTNDSLSLEEKESAIERIVNDFKEMYLRIRTQGRSAVNEKYLVDQTNDFYAKRYPEDETFGEFMIDLDTIIPSFDFLNAASRRKSCSSYYLYFNHFPRFVKGPLKGSPHQADLALWFDFDLFFVEAYANAGIKSELYDEDDEEIKRMFSSIIAEFARSGNPGLALRDVLPFGWPKYEASTSYFLNFNLKPWIDRFPIKDKQEFWINTIPSLLRAAPEDPSTVVVGSPFGKIQGVKKTDENTGLSYVSFQGIPYAKPPLGDLRFAKPQPHPNIDDVFDASKDARILCPHPDSMSFNDTNTQEDCLILNIQAKDLHPSNGLRKVVVFIHGGHFLVGSSSFYDSKSFVSSQDVIVVTINYRLGILGFLSTENEASPGNYGLWDQTLAIKWVKDNIRAFGGDPDDIAIAGESAGGVSVGYQTISPHTKGLFSKAFQQSGAATSVFGRSINAQSHALSFAKSIGCWEKNVETNITVEDSKAIVTCLREAPLSVIIYFNDYIYNETQFAPVVDGDFIPNIPSKLLRDDLYLESIGFFDRSYLIAINNNEGAMTKNALKVTTLPLNKKHRISEEEEEESTKKRFLQSRLGETFASDVSIRNEIDDFYSREISDDQITDEMVTDLNFLVPSLDVLIAASMRKSCSPYLLYFNHFPQFMKGQYKGSAISLDLLYWFDFKLEDLDPSLNADTQGDFSEEDIKLKRLFSTVVGDFVKTGNPGVALQDGMTICWPKFDVTNSHYINFNTKPYVNDFLQKDKQDLWLGTVPKLIKKSKKLR